MSDIKINSQQIYNYSIALFIVAFIVFYFTDGLSKYIFRTNAGFYRFGPIIKGLFEMLVLLYGLITLRNSKLIFLSGILLLALSFLIGQFFLSFNYAELSFLENFNSLFKYLFPLILYLIAIDIISHKKYPVLLLKTYKSILSINSFLILIGILYGVAVFRTYAGINRFGYDGLIFAQNEASFIFIFSITFVYYRRFYLGIKERFFWVTIIPSIFVATKAIYLFLVLLLIYHLVKRVPLKKLLFFATSSILMGYLLFYTTLNKIIINSYGVFMHTYRKGGFLNALLSGRNSYIESKFKPLVFETWSLPNFIFGGQDVKSHYVEMGFLDLFLFFGIFGSIVYLYLFYLIIRQLRFSVYFKYFFIFSLILIIATAGHFFESGIAGLHFIILVLLSRVEKYKLT